MKRESRTVDQSHQGDSQPQRQLPLVDLLVDTRAELGLVTTRVSRAVRSRRSQISTAIGTSPAPVSWGGDAPRLHRQN